MRAAFDMIEGVIPMNKLIVALMAVLLCMTMAFPATAEIYNIGICQLVQHDALDEATQGFKDTLTELMGESVFFNEQNASGDTATCIAIINAFLAEEVDLILANATPSLQAAQSGTGDIPILGTSITDYGAALGIADWTGVTAQNVSGTSDLTPLDAHAALLNEMFPDAKEVGLLYCSAEANSQYQLETIEGYLKELGYSCTYYGFVDSNDVASVTQTACQNSDVLYVPTDNTVASCNEIIRNVIEVENRAIIGGDEAICASCGVATICIDYYELGCATGQMAYEILANGADVSTMPVEFAPSYAKVYNPELCEMLGVTAPDGYEPIG